jgi:hypothetical protein
VPYEVLNPDKPEPKLSAKTKKKQIEFGTQELIKVKTKFS